MKNNHLKIMILTSLAVATFIGAFPNNAHAEHKKHWDIHDRWDRGDDDDRDDWRDRHDRRHHRHWQGHNHGHRHDRWCNHNHSRNSSVFFSYYYSPPVRPVYVAPATWDNPDIVFTDNATYREAPTRTSDGRYCREYQSTVKVGGNRQSSYGTACQQPDGSWEIVD